MVLAGASQEFERLRTELAPDLELVRSIGAGSVGRVYLAREPALRRMVAVKVLREDVAANEVNRLRFEREAQAAASISHRNVITVYRVGRLPGGTPFIVMEYVEGRTLADLIEARGPFSLTDTRVILAAVAGALAAAHRKGIVHRDVRPSNVLWETETNRIVLMDFGTAALLETGSQGVRRLTVAGALLGDPLHMSPEQLRGDPVTPESDLYGLGITAYELLTGAGPFGPRSAGGLVMASHDQVPPALHEIKPEVDTEFSALIRRCLAKSPDHRPRATEVQEALLRAPTPNADSAEGGGLLRHFLRELQRRRVYRVAVGYVAASFLALQAADLVIPALTPDNAENWYRPLLAAVLAGFPVAMVLGWFFDLTSEGVRRSSEVTVHPSRRRFILPALGLAASIAIALAIWMLTMRRSA
jgi:serine/threonine protein kinase